MSLKRLAPLLVLLVLIAVAFFFRLDRYFTLDTLRENLHRLRAMRDQDGQPFRIVELPMPGAVEYDGQRLPASYANFYIANKLVLMPTYRHANDARALAILQRP